jgi:hypothetical protein
MLLATALFVKELLNSEENCTFEQTADRINSCVYTQLDIN